MNHEPCAQCHTLDVCAKRDACKLEAEQFKPCGKNCWVSYCKSKGQCQEGQPIIRKQFTGWGTKYEP